MFIFQLAAFEVAPYSIRQLLVCLDISLSALFLALCPISLIILYRTALSCDTFPAQSKSMQAFNVILVVIGKVGQ